MVKHWEVRRATPAIASMIKRLTGALTSATSGAKIEATLAKKLQKPIAVDARTVGYSKTTLR